MSSRDLTTLDAVKKWLSISTTDSDIVLSSLITQISGFVYNKTSRSFFVPRTVTELYDGLGGTRMLLTNWPVTKVTELKISGTVVPPAGDYPSSGWILEAAPDDPPGLMQRLDLRGYTFLSGTKNVSVTYVAGYQVENEALTTPSSGAVAVAAPYGRWASDMGVTRVSTGLPLAKVASAPSSGQYSVDASGNYTFGDSSIAVLVSYGYIPADLERAVIEWVAERFKYKDRIGYRSKSLGGAESVSFDNRAIPEIAGAVIQTYTRVVSC